MLVSLTNLSDLSISDYRGGGGGRFAKWKYLHIFYI